MNNKLIKIASFIPKSLCFPDSWVGHMPFSFFLVDQLKPKILVELGTHTGNSYFSFCQSVASNKTNTKCYAVDTWQGDEHAGSYSEEIYEKVFQHNEENYKTFSNLMRMTFDEAVDKFEDRSINLLHIDGLHTYEAVKHDFKTWLPKMADGGVVLFHDTQVRERDFGVWELWAELKQFYSLSIEFRHSNGLGVIKLQELECADSCLGWLIPDSLEQKMFVDYFAGLGDALLQRYKNQELNNTIVINQKQILSYTQALTESQKQVASHAQALTQLSKQHGDEIAAKELKIIQLSNFLAAIQNSRSWRYTAMLRTVSNQVRIFINIYKRAKQVTTQVGGFLNLIKKVIAVTRKHGLAGLQNRISGKFTEHKSIVVLNNQTLDRNDYQAWIKLYDTLDDRAIEKIKAEISEFSEAPKISVVMPVFNVSLNFLEEAIKSVQNQIYENWELCIADDASTDKEIRSFLESLTKQDSRIKVVFREKNGHISAAANSALELATGGYVALLDNDDLLPMHALFHVVKAILANPDVELIYSDEDKVNAQGFRFEPYFKCELNYELLLAQNMICHLAVYRRDILREVKGFRVGYEGAQDYDLALRVLEKVGAQKIAHIPKVLYHWRAISGSTALNSNEKCYAADAARRAVSEHLVRSGRGGLVSEAPEVPSMNRVRYQLPNQLPLISIIIPTRDRSDLLKICLDSLMNKTSYENYEVIIVDNGSIEAATKEFFKSLSKGKVRIIRDDLPFNYSRLNNLAVEQSKGDVICLMNNDIEILTPDWLEEMLSFVMQPDVGCVGARLWYPDGRLQHGGVISGIGGVAGHSHKYLKKGNPGYFSRAVLHQSLSAVTGACLMIRKSVWNEVGGLEEQLAVAFNDIDFCLKVKKYNYRNIYTPYAEMIHHESLSRGPEDNPEKVARFNREASKMKERWGDKLFKDPAYSPNLTLDCEDFSYSWPPRT